MEHQKDKKLVVPEDQVFCVKIQCESQANRMLPNIHNKLSDQLLKQLEAYFGHLLHIDELKWSNSIVHGLMAPERPLEKWMVLVFFLGNVSYNSPSMTFA
ncbi:hypothetical protein Pyn_34689 [Prunus yedoensis var. nudiflora]|uniref:Uncharacterized protein n=1 Tax=Prunus yedoensis var. nudiflora TaxID=2094558 RepID=A0A314YBF3_PRUYE|nr:hypothetical protein Pyn_34689 [Prunus yedoensis var. nudiflora]